MKLSICIPTYNRADYIGQTLASICSEATEDVEIVVSDNASQDETGAIVERFREQFPRIKYFRWPSNAGADRNFLKVVEIAEGEYCWLMGSDDIVQPGAMRHVLEAIDANAGIAGISVNVRKFNIDLSEVLWKRPMGRGTLSSHRLFTDAESAFSVLGYDFGFLSGQIVNRAVWNHVTDSGGIEPYFNAYVHVYVIAQMLRIRPRWLYLHHKCVGWRSGNDSFLSEGMYKRLELAVVGYEKMTGDVFGRTSPPYRNMMKMMAEVGVTGALVNAKVNDAPLTFYTEVLALTFRLFWRLPAFWFITLPTIIAPRFLIVALRWLYRMITRDTRIRDISG